MLLMLRPASSLPFPSLLFLSPSLPLLFLFPSLLPCPLMCLCFVQLVQLVLSVHTQLNTQAHSQKNSFEEVPWMWSFGTVTVCILKILTQLNRSRSLSLSQSQCGRNYKEWKSEYTTTLSFEKSQRAALLLELLSEKCKEGPGTPSPRTAVWDTLQRLPAMPTKKCKPCPFLSVIPLTTEYKLVWNSVFQVIMPASNFEHHNQSQRIQTFKFILSYLSYLSYDIYKSSIFIYITCGSIQP